MDVHVGKARNSKTAWRNRSAPRRAVASGPPSRRISTSRRRRASRSSWWSVRRGSGVHRGAATSPTRSASATNALKRTSRADLGVVSRAKIARCRRRLARSKKRAASPCNQFRTVPRLSPKSRATSVIVAPGRTHASQTSIGSSTAAVLPGSTSQGSTRSQCPQARHTAWTRVSSTRPLGRRSPRRTLRRIRWSASLRPHLAQLQPTRTSSPAASMTCQ